MAAYLTVPQNMPQVKRIAEELAKKEYTGPKVEGETFDD